jgi:ABC-type transport system involved in multi-copper enzyme maturation permease subunit
MGFAKRMGRAIFGVVQYELLRSLTPIRIGLWVAMILFPVFLILVAAFSTNPRFAKTEQYQTTMTILFFVLLPEIVTILGMLLWATPIVNAEMEGQTWIYSVIRPEGRRGMLIGKYLVAVLWTVSCGWVAASIAIPFLGYENPLRLWFVSLVLCLLSSIAHGALFTLIGVLMQRRGMVLAFFYAAVIEGVLGWIPAVINKFTIAYRIRSLMVSWLEMPLNRFMRDSELVSDGVSDWVHVAWLLGGAAVLLSIALWRVQAAQYVGKSGT